MTWGDIEVGWWYLATGSRSLGVSLLHRAVHQETAVLRATMCAGTWPWLGQGSTTVAFWARGFFLMGGCILGSMTFGNISGLYLLDSNSNQHLSPPSNVQQPRILGTSKCPLGIRKSLVKNHWQSFRWSIWMRPQVIGMHMKVWKANNDLQWWF